MSEFEVLLSVDALEPEAYPVAIRKHLSAHIGENVSYGKLYGALFRLEDAGLVRSESRSGSAERGWRERLLYWLTEEGKKKKSEEIVRKSSKIALKPTPIGAEGGT